MAHASASWQSPPGWRTRLTSPDTAAGAPGCAHKREDNDGRQRSGCIDRRRHRGPWNSDAAGVAAGGVDAPGDFARPRKHGAGSRATRRARPRAGVPGMNATEIAAAVTTRQTSAIAVITDCLARIERLS